MGFVDLDFTLILEIDVGVFLWFYDFLRNF